MPRSRKLDSRQSSYAMYFCGWSLYALCGCVTQPVADQPTPKVKVDGEWASLETDEAVLKALTTPQPPSTSAQHNSGTSQQPAASVPQMSQSAQTHPFSPRQISDRTTPQQNQEQAPSFQPTHQQMGHFKPQTPTNNQLANPVNQAFEYHPAHVNPGIAEHISMSTTQPLATTQPTPPASSPQVNSVAERAPIFQRQAHPPQLLLPKLFQRMEPSQHTTVEQNLNNHLQPTASTVSSLPPSKKIESDQRAAAVAEAWDVEKIRQQITLKGCIEDRIGQKKLLLGISGSNDPQYVQEGQEIIIEVEGRIAILLVRKIANFSAVLQIKSSGKEFIIQ